MEPQPPLPDIPQRFLEYKASFKQPIFFAWYDPQKTAITDLYNALLPWGIDLEKVSWTAAPKNLKEAQITFSVPQLRVVVTLGLGTLTMVANNAEWVEAQQLSSLFETVLSTVLKSTAATVQSQQTVLAFHIKPGPKPFREIMRQYVNAQALGKEDASMIGVGLYGVEHSILIDNSLVVADGLFVKVTRMFPTPTSFGQMATILWRDEETLLRRLGFRTPQ